MSEEKRRDPRSLIVGALLLAVGAYAIVSGIRNATDNIQPLVAPSGAIRVEVVDTTESRQLGLSGRDGIGDGEGMLFVFPDSDPRNCFWMKDMKFTIDMIWLDEDKRVLNVSSGVTPETFPQSFCPEGAAKYGLEVGDGRAEALGIVAGEALRF